MYICICICPSLIYIYAVVFREGGGFLRSTHNIVAKFSQLPLSRSNEIQPTTSCCHFFLSGLSIL